MTAADGLFVGVIIPTRNRFDLTRQAIVSVRAQTYPRWHLYLVDDLSNDGSTDALAEVAARDPRITLVRNLKRRGAQGSRQAGLEVASEPLIATLDSDDLWLPEKLAAQVDALRGAGRGQPAVGVALCWHDYVNMDGTRRGRVAKPDLRGRSFPFAWYNMSTPLMDRQALDEAGGFERPGVSIPHTRDHLDFFLRLTSAASATVVPRLLVRCRHHPGPRNSDGLGTREAADASAALLRLHEEDLAERPRERAWLHGLVGARYLMVGDRRRGLAYLASGIGTADAPTAARIVRYYAPFTIGRLMTSGWRA